MNTLCITISTHVPIIYADLGHWGREPIPGSVGYRAGDHARGETMLYENNTPKTHGILETEKVI